MDIRYFIDPATDQPHIYNHDVDESEIEDILERPVEDRAGQGGVRVAIGQSADGRYLRVIYKREPIGQQIVVITAYELTPKQVRAFRRRRRKRWK